MMNEWTKVGEFWKKVEMRGVHLIFKFARLIFLQKRPLSIFSYGFKNLTNLTNFIYGFTNLRILRIYEL